MTVAELIEELKEIDEKYHDHEIVIYNNGSADKYYISDVGKENEWEDEQELYITVSQKGKQMSCLHNEEVRESIKDELEGMSMNDFSNLVEKHDLGVDIIDDIFYQLVEKIMEERSV